MNFKVDFCISSKYTIGILIRIALSLQIALGSFDVFTLLCIPIHEHRMSFIIFVSFISFNNVL